MAIVNLTHLTGQIMDGHLPSGLGLPLAGVLTEYRSFPASGLVKVPEHLSDEEGSTLPIAAATAWTAMNWMRPIGDSVKGTGKIVLLQELAVFRLLDFRWQGERIDCVSTSTQHFGHLLTASSHHNLLLGHKA